MTNSFELKGIFWLPDVEAYQVHGILKYEPEHGVTLDIIGAFVGKKHEFDFILGFIENGKYVTLYNCFEIQRGFSLPGMNTSKIFANYALLGSYHVGKKSQLKFQMATIYLKNLDEWVNKREGFQINEDYRNNEVVIKYKLPENIVTKIEQNFKLTLNPTAKWPGWSLVQKEAKVTQRINCGIEYNNKKPFFDILEDINHFEQFLILCSQRPTYPLEFYLLNKDNEGNFSNRFDIYYKVSFENSTKKDLIPLDFLVSFNYIQGNIGNIFKSWFSTKRKLDTCYVPFFNNYYGHTLYTSDKFLNICRALEAFHRVTVGVKNPLTGSKFSYKERVIEVINLVKYCCNSIVKIRNTDSFAEKIKNYRNDFTHSNRVAFEGNKKYLEIYGLTEKLTIILSCAILYHIGISKLEIRRMIDATGLYFHLKRKKKLKLS